MKHDQALSAAIRFFYDHAGWSYSAAETSEQGRVRCATTLANAETLSGSLSFEWQLDRDSSSADFTGDYDNAYPLWVCLCRDEDGEIIGSLSAIDFGADGSPWSHPYRRVVEAEIAAEAFDL